MTKLGLLLVLLVAACDTGAPGSPESSVSRVVPAAATPASPPGATPPPGVTPPPVASAPTSPVAPIPIPIPTSLAPPTMVTSTSLAGADQQAFDYATTADVFVRVTFSNGSFDGRTLRLATSALPGGGVMTMYQTQVVSTTATFDFAVSGTLFGRNAQPGLYGFAVSDAVTQAPLAARQVKFTVGGQQ